MGVFHISGVGTSPGAVTVPLTYIYCLLKLAYERNNSFAREFFSGSGEENEQYRGKPEGLVIFSSNEVINRNFNGNFACRLSGFNINDAGRIPDIIINYLTELTTSLNLGYQPLPLKYFLGIPVEISEFDDIFKKAYVTLNALRDKEVWINLVGGANQINLALMLAGALVGKVNFYYVFEWGQNGPSNTLHPFWMNSLNWILENNPCEINRFIEEFKKKWIKFPPLILQMSELINNLNNMFQAENAIVNIGQIRNFLRQYGDEATLLLSLRGSYLNIQGEEVTRGPFLNWFDELRRYAQGLNINNLTDLLRNNDFVEIFLRND